MRIDILKSQTLALLALFVSMTLANKAIFDVKNNQMCSGMYSKQDWGGNYKSKIEFNLASYDGKKYKKSKDVQKIEGSGVGFVIYEFKDFDSIGIKIDDYNKKYICDDEAIEKLKLCNKDEKGKALLGSHVSNSTVMTSRLTHLGLANINYTVEKTGYYCVYLFSIDDKKFKGVVNFQNAYGHLGASDIPLLPAYGILTICYLIALALFGFQFFKKRKENQILPLQRYLLAMLAFLTFDTMVVWSYYDLVNRTSSLTSPFVTFYMFFLSILDALKVTFSFFLLLCIALGYGVVLLKLSKKVMFRCKILAGLQFLASLGYLVPTYYKGYTSTVTSSGMDETDETSFWGLLPLIPISITLNVYYISILSSLRRTTANLHEQRQIIKLQLYENLFRIICAALIITFGGLVLSTFIYMSMSAVDVVENNWKSAFFIFDFWPSAVFFFVFLGIAWLWRPTETSYMLAVSKQLSTEENGDEEQGTGAHGYHQGHEFELDDLSLLSHSDEEDRERHSDSFELSRSQSALHVSPDNDTPQKSEVTSDGFQSQTGESNNTLFKLNNEDDAEDSDSDERKDDRLTSQK